MFKNGETVSVLETGSDGKPYLGAWIGDALQAGIESWSVVNPGLSRSYFLIKAAVEKLDREGIPVDLAAAFDNGRAAKNQPLFSRKSSGALQANDAVNSAAVAGAIVSAGDSPKPVIGAYPPPNSKPKSGGGPPKGGAGGQKAGRAGSRRPDSKKHD